MSDDTLIHRPAPRRPLTGWLAWQATIGYLHNEYSPDAALTVTAYPISSDMIRWSASATWETTIEAVHNEETLAAVLGKLWAHIEVRHRIFKTLDAAARRPAYYAPEEWLDVASQAALDRLIQAAAAGFESGWRVAITYQAVDNPEMRVQAALIAREETIHVTVGGPSLREACQILYRSAALYLTNKAR
jgi:hypothetical protein